MKLLLKIAYLGTNYSGYQVQPNGVTVQQRLNEATKALFGFDCDIVGCSRTDSGVHARGFVCAVTRRGEDVLPTTVPVSRIPRALNVLLPADIAVLHAALVPHDFHPRYDVISKEYEYLYYNGSERSPFLAGRAMQLPQPLDAAAVAAMDRAAKGFVGKYDFAALCDGGSEVREKDTVREIFAASVRAEGDLISFRVRGNGFLYHMVRVMAGTLLAVARGKIPAEEIKARLLSLDRTRFGSTAPADGLYLDSVFYEADLFGE